jgi:hypothetical protein
MLKIKYGGTENGGPVQTRTADLLRVNRFQNCNLLILGASAAPKSTESHPKSTFSTIVSTIRTQKEKVAEEVQTSLFAPQIVRLELARLF